MAPDDADRWEIVTFESLVDSLLPGWVYRHDQSRSEHIRLPDGRQVKYNPRDAYPAGSVLRLDHVYEYGRGNYQEKQKFDVTLELPYSTRQGILDHDNHENPSLGRVPLLTPDFTPGTVLNYRSQTTNRFSGPGYGVTTTVEGPIEIVESLSDRYLARAVFTITSSDQPGASEEVEYGPDLYFKIKGTHAVYQFADRRTPVFASDLELV